MAGTGASVVSSPVAAWNATLGKTLVYLGNEAGYLTAFDEATGATVWSARLPSSIRSTPLVEGGYVWVTTAFSPQLYKLNAATGATMCQLPLASESDGSPTIGTPAGGHTTIYVGVTGAGAQGGPIYAVNEADCSLHWSFSAFNTPEGTWDPLSFGTDATGRSLLLFGSGDPDNTVYAVDALTGAKVWWFKCPPLAGNTDTDVGAGVSISAPGANGFPDGVAYIPDEDGNMFALDLTTGALLWSYDFGTGKSIIHLARSTPAVVGNQVIFGENSGVTSLDATSGALQWSFDTGGVESLSAVAVVGRGGGRVVAVTTLSGAFDVLSARTGQLLYRYQTPSFTTSSVADVEGNLLAESADGFLYDLAPHGGNGPAPTTAVTAPANGAWLGNPVGSLRLTGTANGTAITGVDVAVQAGGSSGPWWDAQAGTWTAGFFDNAAAVTTPGAASTTWSFNLPVPPTGGSFRVLVSAVQSNGIADVSDLSAQPGSTNVTFTIGAAPGYPHVYAQSGPWVAPGTPVSIAGSGFQAGETVTFSLAGTSLGSTVASSTGAIGPTPVSIPVSALFGPAAVTATGQASGRTGTAPIYVSNEWAQSGYDGTGSNSEPNDPVLLHYVAPGPPDFLDPAWTLPTAAPVRTSLSIVRDVGYFGDDAGGVTAVDVRNSEPLWSSTEGSAIDSSPAVSSTRVFFGTKGGSVIALNSSDGSQSWATSTSSAVESAPALAGANLYVGSDDGTVYALQQATGAVVWQAKLPGSVLGSPAVDLAAGVVVVGDSSGTVTAMSSTTGQLLWTVPTGGPVTATGSILRGVVYIGSSDGDAYALSETTGQTVWRDQLGSPVTATGVIFTRSTAPEDYVVGTSNGQVFYLNLTDGARKHVTTVGGPVVGLAGATGWVAVTMGNGQLWGLKRYGEPQWETSVGAPFAAAPTVLNGVVYTTGTDETVRAYTVPGTPIP